ncbi:hypothetical protein CK203_017889 [Vitis vinifera]|uniref:Uncharacterized protein n=1 Tax=Vitis vinifera TaxID=29760 RepID=A0A438JW89_VITVI|nr:hypothetical protein CK203_017889 [Vitis vinifera]
MDAVLQIFKRSICPDTPFFESLAKKPPTTMDDLFRRANKYSMLEDDVRAATQQVLVAGRASRDNADRHAKPPDRPKPVDQRQEGPSRPDRPPITPLSISYEKLLPMIQGLSDFRWPRPLETDPSIRDRSKKCAFHKTMVIQQRHVGGKDRNCCEPRQYANALIHPAGSYWGGPSPIDGTIIFPPVDPTRTLQPHRDALILSLEIGDFDSRGSRKPRTNLIRIQRIINNILRRHIYCRFRAGPVTLNVQFSVVQRVVTLQCHLGTHMASLHETIPSTYHQMVSFLTNEGQTDLYGSQLAARQCYQIARETIANQEDASPPEPGIAHDQ